MRRVVTRPITVTTSSLQPKPQPGPAEGQDAARELVEAADAALEEVAAAALAELPAVQTEAELAALSAAAAPGGGGTSQPDHAPGTSPAVLVAGGGGGGSGAGPATGGGGEEPTRQRRQYRRRSTETAAGPTNGASAPDPRQLEVPGAQREHAEVSAEVPFRPAPELWAGTSVDTAAAVGLLVLGACATGVSVEVYTEQMELAVDSLRALRATAQGLRARQRSASAQVTEPPAG